MDLITDLHKCFKVLKRVATGDMTVNQLIFGVDGDADAAPIATPDDPKCELTSGCLLINGHAGGCTLPAVGEDKP